MAFHRLGWEFDFGREALAWRACCSICGRRNPRFRLGWKDWPSTCTGRGGAGIEPISVLEVAASPTIGPNSLYQRALAGTDDDASDIRLACKDADVLGNSAAPARRLEIDGDPVAHGIKR